MPAVPQTLSWCHKLSKTHSVYASLSLSPPRPLWQRVKREPGGSGLLLPSAGVCVGVCLCLLAGLPALYSPACLHCVPCLNICDCGHMFPLCVCINGSISGEVYAVPCCCFWFLSCVSSRLNERMCMCVCMRARTCHRPVAQTAVARSIASAMI